MMSPEEINNRFGFHKATVEGVNATAPAHKQMRLDMCAFATKLNDVLPDGREKSLAFTALEEASMWAHKALASQAPLENEGDGA